MLTRALLLLLMLWTIAAGDPGAARGAGARGAITVLAAGDLRGEIMPCGCSPEGQLGGLPRRLSYLEQATSPGDTLLVDLGNNFPPPSPQGTLKIDLIQQLLAVYMPAAVLPGPNDLALGPGKLSAQLPYLLSNDTVGEAFLPYRVVERGGRRVGLLGYLSPAELYQGSQERFRLQVVDAALLKRWRTLREREQMALAVLLFRGPDAELDALVSAQLFDLIVVGNPSDNEMAQITGRPVNHNAGGKAGPSVLPQVPTKGQGVLRLRLEPGASVGDGPAQVDWLGGDWADHPQSKPVFARYDEQVKALFFASMAAKQRQQRESPFAGAQGCVACHAEAQQVWQVSRHATALATLARVGRQFDPECLACHVVGLEQKGYISADITPTLANVQCENCHGPSKAHSTAPQIKPAPVPSAGSSPLERPDESTCRTCHKGSHSPSFDFAVYWPKVRHGSRTPTGVPGTGQQGTGQQAAAQATAVGPGAPTNAAAHTGAGASQISH